EDDEAELMESLEIKILHKLDINNPYTEQRVTS
ncbi:rRNA maturation factor, partial [Methylophaga nitratireducenticrescens]